MCFIVAPHNEHKQINAFTHHDVDSYLYGTQYQSERVTSLRFKDHPRLADVRALEVFQARYFNELYKPLYREGSCFMTPEKSHDRFASECAGAGPRIVLWGDSHAAHLWPGLKAATLPGETAQWTASGCPPLIGEAFAKRPHCRAINEWVLGKVRQMRPQVLILAGAWIKHDEATIRRGLGETLSRLGADPAWRPRIVLVGSVPAWRKPLPKLLASDFLGGDERTRSTSDLDPDMTRRDALIRELATGRAEFFSPIAAACNEEGCLRYIEKDGTRLPFAFDYGHLIEESSVMVVAALFRQLAEMPSMQAARP